MTRERRERGARILEDWKSRYSERANEIKMKEVEDNVKHLSVSTFINMISLVLKWY